MDLAICGARHDDRAFPHLGAFEVARRGHLGFQAHITPVATVEKALQLFFVADFVGVHGKRDAAGAFRFPLNGLLAHGVSSGLPRIIGKALKFINRKRLIIEI
jgi:hypothetical protein